MINKPESIKIAGIVVIVIASISIIASGVGLLFSSILSYMGNELEPISGSANTFNLLSMLRYLETSILILGILYLVGGIFILKYRMWANRLVVFVSIAFCLMLIGLTFFTSYPLIPIFENADHLGFKIYKYIIRTITALGYCVPIGLLIWFLSKKNTIIHFS